MFMHNIKQLLICLDQLVNVLVGLVCNRTAWADETLSARAYRLELEHQRSWARKLIDALLWFDKDHCKSSYMSEVKRRHSPPIAR